MVRVLSDHPNGSGNAAPPSPTGRSGASPDRVASTRRREVTRRASAPGSSSRLTSRLQRSLKRLEERVECFFATGPGRQSLWQLLQGMERHRAGRTANAMAFDLFLAFLPMLALAGWALTHFVASGPELLEASSLLADLTPDQLREIIRTHFESLSAATLAPVAAVSGWWLASSAFHTMIGVFEEAFDCPRRPWWRSRLLALGYALAGMAVFMLSGVLGVTLSTPPGLVGELLVSLRAHGLVRPAFLLTGLAVMTAFFALLYGVAIRRPGVRRRIWPGAFTAASLGGSASFLLGYYAGQVARFALFYGSLAAVAILLLWLWVWCAAILLGAELNVLLENRGAAPRPRPEASGSRQC